MELTVADNIVKTKTTQIYWALLVFLITAVAIVFLRSSNSEAAMTATLGFIFGYILQHSRFCFAAAFRDIFMIRNTSVSRAVLLLIILTSFGFAMVHGITGDALPAGGIIYPVGVHTAVGGIIFGFGMVIAGNCVTGCLMRMGEGYLMQWLTFLGLLIGSALGAWNLGWWGPISIERSPVIFFPENFGWPASLLLYSVAITLLYLLAVWYERGSLKNLFPSKWKEISLITVLKGTMRTIFSSRSWSYTLGAVALAITGTLTLYLWGKPAAITGGLTHFVGWIGLRIGFNPLEWYYFEELIYFESRRIFLEHPLLYLAAGIVIGSLFASLLHREFKIRRVKSYRFVISALVGGAMLGYSSRVAMGCNFGGFWGGLSSFSLHGWVFGV